MLKPMRSILVSLAVVTCAISAAAQDRDPVLAETLFREGQRLMNAGRVDEACPKLEESLRLDPTTGTLLNVALCHQKQGKVTSAWVEFNRAASESARAGQKEREQFAREHSAELENKIARAELVIAQGLTVERVTIDDREIPKTAWSVAIPLDPGDHSVVFRGDGGKTKAVRVSLAEGKIAKVELAAFDRGDATHTDPDPPPHKIEPDVPPKPSEPKSSTGKILGWSLAGVGAAGIGVGTVFGIVALGKKSDVDAHCNGKFCDDVGFGAQDDARTMGTISTIGFVVGGVALAAGVYFLVTSSSSAKVSAMGPSTVGWAF